MSNKSQHIVFILDRSGSMANQTNDVIGGFNTYVDEIKEEAAKDGMETVVSLVTFADTSEVVHAAKLIAEIPPISNASYRPRGRTALLDAVHSTVSKYLEKLGQGEFGGQEVEAPAVLVVVFTDGEENASTHANWSAVQSLIERCEGLGNWTFAYVGAHADAWKQSSRLRFQAGNTLSAEDMTFNQMTKRLSDSTKLHRAQVRDLDVKKTSGLFEEGTIPS